MARKGGRRKGKSTILTDTPEKNEIALRAAEKNKNIKRKLFDIDAKTKKQKNNVTRKQKYKKTEKEDEEDSFCMICSELYSRSKSGETWIQCCKCKFWSHEACTKSNYTAYYICDNCEADNE